MIYLFVVICLCVLLFVPDSMALAVSSEHLLCACTYQFAHAGWLHLCINALSLLVMFNPIYKVYINRIGYISPSRFFIYCYLGSVLAGLCTAQSTPTVGASGIVFFLLGVLLMLNPTLRQLRGYIAVAIAIGIQIYSGNSNISLHISAFVFGCLFIIMHLLWKRTKAYLSYDD